jgi:hypothetical protein
MAGRFKAASRAFTVPQPHTAVIRQTPADREADIQALCAQKVVI